MFPHVSQSSILGPFEGGGLEFYLDPSTCKPVDEIKWHTSTDKTLKRLSLTQASVLDFYEHFRKATEVYLMTLGLETYNL